MKISNLVLFFFQIASVSWAIALVFLAKVPCLDIVGLCIVCCCIFFPRTVSARHSRRAEWLAGGIIGLISLSLPISLFLASKKLSFLENYYAVVAWLVGGSISVTAFRAESGATKTFWKILAVVWLSFGELIWFGGAYIQNRPDDFYAGIIVFVALLVICKLWFRLPFLAILSVNTCILILIFLPLADLVLRPTIDPDPQPDVAGNDYLYAKAKKYPNAYSAYWWRYMSQYERLMREAFVPDPEQMLPYLIRTNSNTSFFQSRIHINGDGFRGKEIAHPKGRTYRILVLGESNTFGFTLTPDHKPWPEYLEDMIRNQMQPDRPFEVINAGLPHHSLENNLYRLKKFILALEPDMIISYHGWNGFPWLYPALPPVFIKHRPSYRQRPLWLLSECEYRMKLLSFRRSLTTDNVLQMPPISKLMQTRYASAYRDLIALTKTNGIRLVIANYSMAVNSASNPDVIEFYRGSFPSVYPAMQVNEMHSMLVKEITRQHPEVCFVDTHPQLDGEHDKFADLVHFAPEGDLQMAESFFGSISNLLRQELFSSDSKKLNH